MDTKKLEGAFLELVEADTEAALQLVTGMFVGLTLEYMRRRGHDPSGDIRIDSGGKRDITIHKAGSPAGYCSEGSRCVCGGDTPRVRAGCANWVTPNALGNGRAGIIGTSR